MADTFFAPPNLPTRGWEEDRELIGRLVNGLTTTKPVTRRHALRRVTTKASSHFAECRCSLLAPETKGFDFDREQMQQLPSFVDETNARATDINHPLTNCLAAATAHRMPNMHRRSTVCNNLILSLKLYYRFCSKGSPYLVLLIYVRTQLGTRNERV